MMKKSFIGLVKNKNESTDIFNHQKITLKHILSNL